MERFKSIVRNVEANLDIPLGLGFVIYGLLASQYLAIVGAGLGFMRYLIHRALNPKNGYESNRNGHEKTAEASHSQQATLRPAHA